MRPEPADARRLFRDVPVVHVATNTAEGWPHVVPLWFVWLEDAIYVSSRRGGRTHRNVSRDPRVAMAFDRGRAWTEFSGAMVHGWAELLPTDVQPAKRAMSAWFEKYRGELSGTQFGVYVEQVPHPLLLRVVPEDVRGWAHARSPRRLS
jgi:nitroimidazol reductase NimA-like FMN-containing flavoprotein (pyridoxamine 5'-phosphate oxidase superfamily)